MNPEIQYIVPFALPTSSTYGAKEFLINPQMKVTPRYIPTELSFSFIVALAYLELGTPYNIRVTMRNPSDEIINDGTQVVPESTLDLAGGTASVMVAMESPKLDIREEGNYSIIVELMLGIEPLAKKTLNIPVHRMEG
ncbi:hypothetical protein [Paenilisteria newyorkensis]|uniref:hypothetical protein n=1 Tax=Listeria newyorkensis TaxID=1497681 RepID=UPI0023581335|nr:hypothetical protein [Listeria newyorkensis]WAO21741.1 hypothetical protein OTR81_00065 [Listeria newyorkensis]